MDHEERAELLGLPFDRMTMRSAVDRCLSWCTGTRIPRTVVTANAAIVCMMQRDPELLHACRSGDLILADGMSVVWTSKATDVSFPERVPGVELMERLLEEAGKRSLSVYFLGAKPEVVRKLAEDVKARYPGIVVAGHRDGYFGPEEHDAIVEDIREKAPHMLFVGMPSPFKETWCERHRSRLGVPVIMGVGGSFDVLAGHTPRAPRWLRAMGMEWSWRLLMEPRRMWKRYLVTNSEFLWLAAREVVARRFGGDADPRAQRVRAR